MEYEAVGVFALQRIYDLPIACGSERRHHQCLGFAASKQRRAMSARQCAGADGDRPYRAGVAAVYARLALENLVAHDFRFHIHENGFNQVLALRIGIFAIEFV